MTVSAGAAVSPQARREGGLLPSSYTCGQNSRSCCRQREESLSSSPLGCPTCLPASSTPARETEPRQKKDVTMSLMESMYIIMHIPITFATFG